MICLLPTKKKLKKKTKAKRKVSSRVGSSPRSKQKVNKKPPHRFNEKNAKELGRKGGLASRGHRGPDLISYMRKLLTDAKTGDLNERGQEFVDRIISHAENGQPRIITEILNRLCGKVPDRVIATVDHGVLAEIPDDELAVLANGHNEEDDDDDDSGS